MRNTILRKPILGRDSKIKKKAKITVRGTMVRSEECTAWGHTISISSSAHMLICSSVHLLFCSTAHMLSISISSSAHILICSSAQHQHQHQPICSSAHLLICALSASDANDADSASASAHLLILVRFCRTGKMAVWTFFVCVSKPDKIDLIFLVDSKNTLTQPREKKWFPV